MILAVSLSKSFGAGGAALVVGDPVLARTIILMGGTLTFGGPIHPGVLGAAVRSADLHLSSEHAERQTLLYERIDLVNRLVVELGLPVPSLDRTPITFVRVGTPENVIRMTKIMMTNGYFLNAAGYPAVPLREGGVRFTVTASHSLAEIEAMIFTLAEYINLPDEVDLTDESTDLIAASQTSV
jgi:7-keto-8-aminopelargonate synthetase-like enzyme